MNLTRHIQATIQQRKELPDKHGQPFLILELDNQESILVFSGKVNQARWDWLKAGQLVSFTVEEGRNGANLLVDFVIET